MKGEVLPKGFARDDSAVEQFGMGRVLQHSGMKGTPNLDK